MKTPRQQQAQYWGKQQDGTVRGLAGWEVYVAVEEWVGSVMEEQGAKDVWEANTAETSNGWKNS